MGGAGARGPRMMATRLPRTYFSPQNRSGSMSIMNLK
jgi:hypothetical protein